MLTTIWINFLFEPLFNALIFIYNNFTYFNLGLAVVYLTIILRLILLPLSIISEKSSAFYKKLADKIEEIEKDYAADPVKKKEVVRKVMRKNRVHPWAKMVVLGIQFLVLILLYQVFIGGINENYTHLYPFVTQPDFINTKFLWLDISQRNTLAAAIVGIILFIEITLSQRKKKDLLTRRDLLYRLFFPLSTFVILSFLPSVKSVFILTSILFSFIIILVSNLIYLIAGQINKNSQ